MKALLCCGLAAMALPGQLLFGQSPSKDSAAKTVFEAASVKLSKPAGSGSCHITPMRLTCTNYRLDTVIDLAYRVAPFEVEGMPSWAHTAFYDITASVERESPTTLSYAENHKLVMACLQDLLENRFHLNAHFEKQLRPGFRLVTKKGGLTIKPSANPHGSGQGSNRIGDDHVITIRNYTMASVANALSGELRCPVVDATGIEGRYSFAIRIPAEERGGSFISALGDFGLKLEADKIEANVFIIQGLERPSDN